MIDSDLAVLYQVENKALNQAVKRNLGRFPPDFMFQITQEEWQVLRSQMVILSRDSPAQTLKSQFVTSKIDEKRGGRRVAPYVFTEQGVAMLSSVINSDRAIETNIQIMPGPPPESKPIGFRASHDEAEG
ncbi:hypothetical protein AGMMS49940_03070 [Spirochaetia bacterium]|nr:hypothetical protein AGMMS49940_03070 [Spirochaetia bacterium]